MFANLIRFLSELFSFINGSRLIELGKRRERERNRKALEEKKKIIREIEDNNIIRLNDRIKRMQSRTDKQ